MSNGDQDIDQAAANDAKSPEGDGEKAPGRSLWDLMSQRASTEDSPANEDEASSGESQDDQPNGDEASDASDAEGDTDEAPKRGLWDVMGNQTPSQPEDTPPEPEDAGPAPATSWSVIGSNQTAPPPPPVPPTPATPSAPTPATPPPVNEAKSTWAVEKGSVIADELDDVGDVKQEQQSDAPQKETEPAAEPPGKGLWGLMQKPAAAPLASDDVAQQKTAESDTTEQEQKPPQEQIAPPQIPPIAGTTPSTHDPNDVILESASGVFEDKWDTPYKDEDAESFDSDESEGDSWDSEFDDDDEPTDPTEETVPLEVAEGDSVPKAVQRLKARPVGRSRKHIYSVICGVLAVALSAMSLWPEVWATFPSTGAGIMAMLLGMMAISELRRAKETAAAMAVPGAGIALGTIGMFLAPTLFAEIGREWKESMEIGETKSRLLKMGEGFESYHFDKNQFPGAGVIFPDPEAENEAIHSWMTELLPYMGEKQLYDSINQARPYDDPANEEGMRAILPQFLSAGSDRDTTGRGFGAAHFSGVGGEVITDDSTIAQLGIFGDGQTVRQGDISDGLSQTFAVGEVADSFPAWGEPENFRAIGRGLNRDIRGFGNADRTGAMFLMADGSVRFFSNKTAPLVLQQLSTRNGAERVPPEFISD